MPTSFGPNATYLFVDGAYLQARLEDLGRAFFDTILVPRYGMLSSNKSVKSFYYDAYPSQKSNESEADFANRMQVAEQRFAKITENRGWHVNFGLTRSEGKKLRQKGVDVKLP